LGFGLFLLGTAAGGTAAARSRAAAAARAAARTLAACAAASTGLVGRAAAATIAACAAAPTSLVGRAAATTAATTIDLAVAPTAAAAATHLIILGAAAPIILVTLVSAARGTLDTAHTGTLAASTAFLFRRQGTVLGRFGRGLAATAGTNFGGFWRKNGAPKDSRRISHHDGECRQGSQDKANADNGHKDHAHPTADFKRATNLLSNQSHAPKSSR